MENGSYNKANESLIIFWLVEPCKIRKCNIFLGQYKWKKWKLQVDTGGVITLYVTKRAHLHNTTLKNVGKIFGEINYGGLWS